MIVFTDSFEFFSRYKREYPPISLLKLQRMIDLNRLDVSKPIDLAAICKTGLYKISPELKQFGINLTDEVRQCYCHYGF